MGRLQMVLYGKSVYSERLAACIRKYKPEYLEFMQYQQQAGNEIVRADILLREEGTDAEVLFIEREVDIQLSRVRQQIQKEKEASIFCYQQGQEILRQVFQIYQKLATQFPCMQYGTAVPNMTVIYAPGGHEQQLLFSMAYAACQGQQKKVLYIDLGAFSGMISLVDDGEGENMGDLFFAVQQRPEKFSVILQGLLHHKGNLDYIHPPDNPSDIFEIEEIDIQRLLQLLAEQTEYGEIVWNCNSWNPILWQLLQQSVKIYFLKKETALGKFCLQESEHFLQKEVCESFREKIQFLSLDVALSNKSVIPGESVWEQLQQGEWGEFVRKLV